MLCCAGMKDMGGCCTGNACCSQGSAWHSGVGACCAAAGATLWPRFMDLLRWQCVPLRHAVPRCAMLCVEPDSQAPWLPEKTFTMGNASIMRKAFVDAPMGIRNAGVLAGAACLPTLPTRNSIAQFTS